VHHSTGKNRYECETRGRSHRNGAYIPGAKIVDAQVECSAAAMHTGLKSVRAMRSGPDMISSDKLAIFRSVKFPLHARR